MNRKRQIILYGGLALLGVYFAADWAYDHFYASPLRELTDKTHDLEDKLAKRKPT